MKPQVIPIHDFSEDDKTSIPFEFSTLEQKTDYDTTKHHRHNYYEIFLFVEGGGYHDIDFQEIPIQPRSVHFVSPGQVHLVRRALDSYGFVLFFSRDFYSLNLQNKDILFDLPFLNNNSVNPAINLDETRFQELFTLMKSVQQEYEANEGRQEDILRSYLNIMLHKSKQFYTEVNGEQEEQVNPVNQLVQSYKILIEKNFSKLHLVKQYADQLSTTPEYLTEATKKVCGKTASEMISDRIVLEAKRLLMYSDLSNKEIAHVLNYDDPSYFSRFLKNKIGMSPSEFRQKMAGGRSD